MSSWMCCVLTDDGSDYLVPAEAPRWRHGADGTLINVDGICH